MRFLIQNDLNAYDLFGTLHSYFISPMSDADKVIIAIFLAMFAGVVLYITIKVLILIWKK